MTRVPDQRTTGAAASEPSGAEARTTHESDARSTTQIRSLSSTPAAVPAPLSGDDARLESSGPVSGRRMSYEPGAQINDKYRLLRPLGAGGMGEVWVAHHGALDIEVAVKFIGDVGSAEAGLAERLLEEARNTARLGHPAIVRALDFGHTGRGDPYIVLELLSGEDLGSRIERDGALTAEHAVALLLPIVHALSAVHDSGIVHRDIKPENVFLAEAELGVQSKLLDFGISRKTDRKRRLTLRDTALGTPDYMSPEQARGETSDARTDQWSFCVVLYEAITRARPFEAENYNALLRSIIEEAPRPFSALGINQPELWRIVDRGLSKDAADRYPDMRSLGEDLARWLIGRGVHEDTVGTSLKRVWLREVSGPFASPFPPAEPKSSPRPRDLSRAVTEAQLPALSTDPSPAPISVRFLEPSPAEAHAPIVQALEEALLPASRDMSSVPDLEALAELHRGGDPEERFQRDSRRRVIVTFTFLTLAIFGFALAILVGTGVLVW